VKIILITGHQYPVGTALSNRIRSYLEVLATLDNEVSVLVYKPTEDRENPQNQARGTLNGIKYKYTAYSLYRPKTYLMTMIAWVYGYLNCLKHLFRENRRAHTDIIILAQARSSLIPLVYLLSRISQTRFVLENSEYPWFLIRRKPSNRIYKPLYQCLYYRMFDGVIAMTGALQRYHQKYGKKTIKIIHLPMTVDTSRFGFDAERENIITYIGNKSYHKDGVGILVDAFVSIADKYPDWRLIIIGDSGDDKAIMSKAQNNALTGRIITMGNIHRDDVPPLLIRSKILALARPTGIQSEGGFPTKLGEYLATGNLVVVTDVGEIGSYLQNGISALVAKPDDVQDFAQKLEQGIVDYDLMQHVRQGGLDVCNRQFNAQIQGRRLNEFFQSMITT